MRAMLRNVHALLSQITECLECNGAAARADSQYAKHEAALRLKVCQGAIAALAPFAMSINLGNHKSLEPRITAFSTKAIDKAKLAMRQALQSAAAPGNCTLATLCEQHPRVPVLEVIEYVERLCTASGTRLRNEFIKERRRLLSIAAEAAAAERIAATHVGILPTPWRHANAVANQHVCTTHAKGWHSRTRAEVALRLVSLTHNALSLIPVSAAQLARDTMRIATEAPSNFLPTLECDYDVLTIVAGHAPLSLLSSTIGGRNLSQYARASLAGIERFVGRQSEHELLQITANVDAAHCGYLVIAEPENGATGADVKAHRHVAHDACHSLAWLSNVRHAATRVLDAPLTQPSRRRFYIVGVRVRLFNSEGITTVPLARPRLVTLSPGDRAELGAPVIRALVRRVIGDDGVSVTYWRQGERFHAQSAIPVRVSRCGLDAQGSPIERNAPATAQSVHVFTGMLESIYFKLSI